MAEAATRLVQQLEANKKLRGKITEYRKNVDYLRENGYAVVFFWNRKFKGLKWAWPPIDFQFGHLSLMLTDGTHISFWDKNTGPTVNETLEEDIIGEGRVPDNLAEIPTHTLVESLIKMDNTPGVTALIPTTCLDEDKVRSWWQNYKTNTRYNGVTNNCSQTVNRALLQGGFARDQLMDLLKEVRKQQYEAFIANGLNAIPMDLGMYTLMFKEISNELLLEIDQVMNIMIDAILSQPIEVFVNAFEAELLPQLEALPESDPLRIIALLLRDQGYWLIIQQVLQMLRELSLEDRRQLFENMKTALREIFPSDNTSKFSLTPIVVFNRVQEVLGAMRVPTKKPLGIF